MVYGNESRKIEVGCPDFVVDRLEVNSLVCTTFEIVDIKIADTSLLDGFLPTMGETFRPGNTALFNHEQLDRSSFTEIVPQICVTVRNLSPVAFEFSGTLYGLSERK